ncbi:MAG: PHP domain-containing protein [Fermentimonas sp.]|nr:PHP domain-containing protein [Fermentimonas sp.]
MLNVNCHLHTPYSFSAFEDIDDALNRAVKEGVKVVGINDFYTNKGFKEWKVGCDKRKLIPLFGIEFISLNQDDQIAGLRVNDPANPGRTYISGKGFAYPFNLPEPFASQLSAVEEESNKQVAAMCVKFNEFLKRIDAGFTLDLAWIKKELTHGSLRERHLARAVRMKLFEHCKDDLVKTDLLLKELFGGKSIKSELTDIASLENEIRANLLKIGGEAYVPEHPDAFLPLQSVCDIIIAAGGIPTYPFLADNEKGEYTDFENNLERVAKQLTERGFHSVEFITTRNDVNLLEKYAGYLHEKGFVVTFGSEHNTPQMEPIVLFARHNKPLTERLKQINFEGACVIAAHQHLVSQGLEGYIDSSGYADRTKRKDFIELGESLIKSV